MKKYLNFVVLAGLVLSLSLGATKAWATETSADASIEIHGGGSNSGSGSIHADLKTLHDDRMEHREDVRDDHQEDRQKRQEDRQAFVAKLKADRASFMADVKTKKDEWKNMRADLKQKFFDAARGMIAARFDAAITAMTNFQVKVDDIIVKLHADGKDTTEASANLDASKDKLDDAKSVVAKIKAEVPADVSTITADLWAQIKLDAREARDDLKESREDLHQAIQEIRSLNGDAHIESHTEVHGGANSN